MVMESNVLVTGLEVKHIRFRKSKSLNAVNPDPDYSASDDSRKTDHPDRLEDHGLIFTIGNITNYVRI